MFNGLGSRIVPLEIKKISDIQIGDFLEIAVDYVGDFKGDAEGQFNKTPHLGYCNDIPVLFITPDKYPMRMLLASNGKEPSFKEGDIVICEITGKQGNEICTGEAIGEGSLRSLRKVK